MADLAVSNAATIPKPAARDPKIWQAAENFEAVLLGQLTKYMFNAKGVGDDSFKGGFAEESWQSMLSEQMGKEIAKRGGVGLADSVYREMIQMQGVVSQTKEAK
jgi:peptidoglycan hydrolase FlgJ